VYDRLHGLASVAENCGCPQLTTEAHIACQVYGTVRLRLPFIHLQALQVPIPRNPDQWEQALKALDALEQIRHVHPE
jgi:hypothetical protein